jgi:hypothetical protein
MLTLKIDNDDSVELPVEIVDTKLTLEEIGALVVFMVVLRGEMDADHPRIVDDRMKEVSKSLTEREIVKIGAEKGALKVTIDLEKAM